MKIIFSRKGFDLSSGFLPSPIFEDNTYFSLPIPYKDKYGIPFADVSYKCNEGKSMNLMELLNQLGNFKPINEGRRSVIDTDLCHFDPDIADNVTIQGRYEPWQRGFGQKNGEQTHLEGQGVKKGDLFIFFGRFQDVIEKNGKYRYKEKSPERHVIFGWMQVGEILEINPNPNENNKNDKSEYPLLKNHPHYNWDNDLNNVIYIPTEELSLNPEKKGYGIFEQYDDKFLLSKNGENMGIWKLPTCFHKDNGISLSKHGKDSRWGKIEEGEDFFNLESVRRGQEFVLNYDNARDETKKEIETWVKNLFA